MKWEHLAASGWVGATFFPSFLVKWVDSSLCQGKWSMLHYLLPLWFVTAAPLPPLAVDQYGDPLPPGALVRLGSVRFLHRGDVKGVAFAPDARTIASVDATGVLRLWDTATGKPLWQTGGSRDRVFAPVLVTPDGKQVLAPGLAGVRVWDAASGKEIRRIGSGYFNRLALSPDGTVLAGGSYLGSNLQPQADVQLWDTATGKELGRLPGKFQSFFALAFSPDGKLVAAANDVDVRIYDMATRQERLVLKDLGGQHTLAFLPDGKTLVVGGRLVTFWDVTTGKKLKERFWGVLNFIASPDGKLFATSNYGPGYVVDAQTGNDVFTLHGHQRDVRSTAVGNALCIHALDGDQGYVSSAAFSHDSKLLATGGQDHTLRLWDVTTRQPILRGGGHTGCVCTVAFLGDNKTIATGGGDGTVRLWEASTGKQLGQHTLGRPASWLTISWDELRFAGVGSQDEARLRLGDVDSGKQLHEWKGEQYFWWPQFSADGKRLAAADRKHLFVWDVVTGQELHRVKLTQDRNGCFGLSPDATVAALPNADYQHVRLVELATGKVVRQLAWPGKEVMRLAFSPDGQRLVGSGGFLEKTLVMWDLRTGKATRFLLEEEGPYLALAFSPDGKRFAAASAFSHPDSPVLVWDLDSGRVVGRFPSHTAGVWALAFSPDGKRLASASGDRTVLVWDAVR
jgi:WD40 repeat protein